MTPDPRPTVPAPGPPPGVAPTNGGVPPNGASPADPDPKRAPAPPGSGRFGLALFLVSLGVLFLAGLVGWAVVRSRAPVWPPAGLPPLPPALAASTILILAASATLEIAARAVPTHRTDRLRLALLATVTLGVAFLVSQVVALVSLALGGAGMGANLWSWLLWFFAALHGLHVVGGLVPLAIVTVNAFHDRWSVLREGPVRHVAVYWHFLGGVWVVIWFLLTRGW